MLSSDHKRRHHAGGNLTLLQWTAICDVENEET